MQLNKLLNSNASVIAVTSTATLLKTLLDTSSGGSNIFRDNLDAVDLCVEDGDIRILYDGNTPTSSKGILVKKGMIINFRKISIAMLRLISVSGSNVAVGVQIGFSDPEEATVLTGGGGEVQGGVASHAADSGNPVKVGGKYNATPPTLDDGDRGDLQLDVKGNTKVTQATTLDKTNDSITNYPVGCTMTVVDLATDADVVVSATPAYLVGFRVDTVMSAHAAIIKDNATALITIAASTAANYNENCYNAIFATNITVESNDAATGKLAIYWRAI